MGLATIRIWDIAKGKLIKVLKGHKGEVKSVAISPDNKILASGSEDKTIVVSQIDLGVKLNMSYNLSNKNIEYN